MSTSAIADLISRVAVLEDREAIHDLYARYLWLLDNQEWETMLAEGIFSDDAELSFGQKGLEATGLVATGARAIVKAFEEVFADLEGTAHYYGNLAIELDGNGGAHVRRYLNSWHWMHSPDPEALRQADFVGVAVQLDELRKQDGRWQITRCRRRSLGPSPYGLGQPRKSWYQRVFSNDRSE